MDSLRWVASRGGSPEPRTEGGASAQHGSNQIRPFAESESRNACGHRSQVGLAETSVPANSPNCYRGERVRRGRQVFLKLTHQRPCLQCLAPHPPCVLRMPLGTIDHTAEREMKNEPHKQTPIREAKRMIFHLGEGGCNE